MRLVMDIMLNKKKSRAYYAMYRTIYLKYTILNNKIELFLRSKEYFTKLYKNIAMKVNSANRSKYFRIDASIFLNNQ